MDNYQLPANERFDIIKSDIKEIKDDVKDLLKITTENRICIAELKVKSSIWGAMGGLCASTPFIIGLIIYILTKK